MDHLVVRIVFLLACVCVDVCVRYKLCECVGICVCTHRVPTVRCEGQKGRLLSVILNPPQTQ